MAARRGDTLLFERMPVIASHAAEGTQSTPERRKNCKKTQKELAKPAADVV